MVGCSPRGHGIPKIGQSSHVSPKPTLTNHFVSCSSVNESTLLLSFDIFSPVGCKGNLSLLDIWSHFSRGLNQMEVFPGSPFRIVAERKRRETSGCQMGGGEPLQRCPTVSFVGHQIRNPSSLKHPRGRRAKGDWGANIKQTSLGPYLGYTEIYVY